MKCRIDWCQRERTPSSLYCREHLADAWRNRLPAREPAWIQRMKEGQLRAKELAA
jgi:hypothetical protein